MRKTLLLGTLVAALVLIMTGCPSPTDYSVELDQTSGINKIDSPKNFNAELITQEEQVSASQTTTVTAAGVLLTWDPVEQAEEYEIYRKPSDEDAWLLVDDGVEMAYFYHMVSEEFPFVVDERYDYRIVAVPENLATTTGMDLTGENELLKSSPVGTNVRVDADAVVSGQQLTAPTVADITLNEDMEPVISWNSVAFATNYSVYRATNDGTSALTMSDFGNAVRTESQIPGRTTFTWADTGAPASGTVHYVVRAMVPNNPLFSSSAFPAAADQTSITLEAALNAVTLDTPADVAAGIRLTWDAVEGADSYKVFRSADGGTSYTDVTVDGSFQTRLSPEEQVTYVDTDVADSNDLVPGQSYSYKVVAYDLDDTDGTTVVGRSNASNALSHTFRALADDSMNLSADPQQDRYIEVTWDIISADGYKVYRSTDGGETYSEITPTVWEQASSSGAANDTYVFWDSDVTAGTAYTYKVVYYNDNDGSASYDEIGMEDDEATAFFGDNDDFIDLNDPLNVVMLAERAVLYWEPVENATHYVLQRNVEESNDYETLATIDATTLTEFGDNDQTTQHVYYEDTDLTGVTYRDGSNTQVDISYRLFAARDRDDDDTPDVLSSNSLTSTGNEPGNILVGETEILPVDDIEWEASATAVTLSWDKVLASSTTVAADGYDFYVAEDSDEDGVFNDEDAMPLTSAPTISDASGFRAQATLTDGTEYDFTPGKLYKVWIVPKNSDEGIVQRIDQASTIEVTLDTLSASSVTTLTVTGINDDDTDNVADAGDDAAIEIQKLVADFSAVNGAKTADNNATDADEYRIAFFTTELAAADVDTQAELAAQYGSGSFSVTITDQDNDGDFEDIGTDLTETGVTSDADYPNSVNVVNDSAGLLSNIGVELYLTNGTGIASSTTYYVYVFTKADVDGNGGTSTKYSISSGTTVTTD